ncbi:MAG: methyl-accepting chemotaxis protein [Proteobacteria bacterium]|nr:methyl-accepting chemotaxis protein [Pseudomonadota bacterium]
MSIASSLRVSTRIQALVGLALIGLLVLCATALYELKSSMLEERQDKLKSQVDSALSVVKYFHAQARDGKISDEQARQSAKEVLRGVRYSGNEYIFVYQNDGLTFLHPIKPEFEGQSKWDMQDSHGKFLIRELIGAAGHGGDFVEYTWERVKGQPPEPRLAYAAAFEPWKLTVGTGVYIDDLDKSYAAVARVFGGIAIVLLLILSALGWQLGASILRQLGGEPAEVAAVMQRVASGDLSAEVRTAPAGSLLQATGTMVEALRSLVAEINREADSLVDNAGRIAMASDQIAGAADQQSDATSAMAAAIEELTVSSSHISDSATDSSRYSTEAVELAGEGSTRVGLAASAIRKISDTVTDASGRIRALEERARQVSSIANVIKDIAGQTNLLALNAAIEAARAGEQGRGFAVVADEVRKLAERTSAATTEIEQMIFGIQGDTGGAVDAMNAALPEVQEGVELASSAAELLKSIEAGARATLQRVGDVADATREQSAASTAIAQRVEQIAGMVEDTTGTIRDTTAIAHHLEGIATNLKQQIGRFRVS